MRPALPGAAICRTFVVVLDEGDEIVTVLGKFADEHDIGAASLSGIGALSRVNLGFWRPATKDYLITEICEQVELLSFSGNIAWLSTERRIHAHVVVGKADGTAQGGHFMEGSVYPTAEIVITELPAKMRRILDEKTGLSLLHTE